jgi:sugar lactone lactonase YvrE
VAVSRDGALWIADTGNSRLRRIDVNGVITTVAGSGNWNVGDPQGIIRRPIKAVSAAIHAPEAVVPIPSGGFKAKLSFPTGLALDGNGNLYIADSGNHRIKKMSADGTITTVAGSGAPGFSGDGGPGPSAQLSEPTALALDAANNLYIADTGNHRIRKLAADGTITTVAGTGMPGFSGDGGAATAAQLRTPYGLAVDTSGSLWIADSGNRVIRKVAPDGTITSVRMRFGYPVGLAIDGLGNVLVADAEGNRVRQLASAAAPGFLAGQSLAPVAGDVNGDGQVGVGDAALALGIAVGVRAATPLQARAADINGDGKVTPADATLILRRAVGL